MSKITSHILDIDKTICKNIEKFDVNERGLLSQNILSQLRNYVEHIALKVFEDAQQTELNNIRLQNHGLCSLFGSTTICVGKIIF